MRPRPRKPRSPRRRPGGDAKILLGVIGAAHGIKGEVRVKSFTADPRAIAAYGALTDAEGRARYRLEVRGMVRGQVIARLPGVADRTAAERLKGLRLFVARAALPEPDEEEYYHADLVGLTAVGADGRALGTVSAVHNFSAGDILEIGSPGAPGLLVPFTKGTVPEVDIAGGRIVIALPAELGGGR